MAVYLSISISQISQNQSANTSTVGVSVIATWKGKSYNRLNPAGYVIIDGARHDFRHSFNANETSAGSQTLYSTNVTVQHDSNGNKTVNCSASFATGVSSGTISASASLALSRITSISSSGSGSTAKPSSNKVTIKHFGLQNGTDRTLYVTWDWSKEHTEHYQVKWYYDTGNSVWFVGSDSTTKERQSTYSGPENAKKVKVQIKPISTTKTVNNKQTSYWTAEWSTAQTYSYSSNPPTKPPTPEVEVKKYKLTASLDNLDVNATQIQFQIVKDDTSVFKTGTATITTSSASYSCDVSAGSEYKVRCRSVKDKEYSEWSEYSSNVSTIPAASSGITSIKATSETSVHLAWAAVTSAKTYDLEYTTDKNYFDSSDGTTTVSSIETTEYTKTGLETGNEYFFRVRAVNDLGHSAWSAVKSVVVGSKPSAPTTWSSATTVITGEPLILYWVHNAEDGSSQTYAELEVIVDGVKDTYTIKNTEDEEEKDKTSFYTIDTTEYSEGVKIQWRVRTAGVTKTYGDWSVQRTVDIYAPPTLQLEVTDVNSNPITDLEAFPFYIYGLPGPETQAPIGYHVAVISNETYETVDEIGNVKMVSKGEEIYSKYFDIDEELLVEMSASNIDLMNNASYTVECTVSMNSGLTATSSQDFAVSWIDEAYYPNAEIAYDDDLYVTYVRPYCEDENFEPIADVMLSLYRREYDGSFTELATELDGSKGTFVTDPHPSLDYARYRVVATSIATGAVSYYDVPGYPIGEEAIIIQWDEQWDTFDTIGEDPLAEPSWSGSLLRLPYNVDVSDKHDADVSLVEYIGREHPVSYYGTQLGYTSTWNTDVPKSDKETLYALRRLARWLGDVYVREPSGSGYWASISVSFNQKHNNLVIPVSLDIKRVEGGA